MGLTGRDGARDRNAESILLDKWDASNRSIPFLSSDGMPIKRQLAL